MQETELSITKNLEKVSLIYGPFLKGNRLERYLIETLYYNFSKDKRLTRQFLKNNAYELGKFISTRLKEIENTPHGPDQEFNLIDCYKEKVAHTVRVRYRFNKMKEIVDEYFDKVNSNGN